MATPNLGFFFGGELMYVRTMMTVWHGTVGKLLNATCNRGHRDLSLRHDRLLKQGRLTMLK